MKKTRLTERFQQLAGIKPLYEQDIGMSPELSPQSDEWLENQVNMYFGGANEPGGEAGFEITRIEQGDPQKYDDAHLAQEFLEELRGLGSIVVRYDDYIGDIKVTSDRGGDAIVTWTWPAEAGMDLNAVQYEKAEFVYSEGNGRFYALNLYTSDGQKTKLGLTQYDEANEWLKDTLAYIHEGDLIPKQYNSGLEDLDLIVERLEELGIEASHNEYDFS